MATIYEVIYHDDGLRLYFFATKKEAKAFKREVDIDQRKAGYDPADIQTTHYPITKQGIVDAMNGIIRQTCHNE